MRVDTTVVETNIHYPTDSSLLGDGVRVLTRAMQKITRLTGVVGAKLRDRTRSVKLRMLEIARATRSKAPPSRNKLKRAYGKLLEASGRVVGQAKRFSREISGGVKQCIERGRQAALGAQRQTLDAIVPRLQQVIHQTKARIFLGDPRSEGKIVSLFELQEAENQIVIDYEVYARRPNDAELLIPSIAAHAAKLGRVPRLVAADASFYSANNEAAAQARGVKRVCIPNRSTKSAVRQREHRKRWFRDGQRWRTGCEGRISVSKRRHGLDRCRYRGEDGMKRWVGLGVIADNLINIGHAIGKQPAG